MIHIIHTGHRWADEFAATCKRRGVPHVKQVMPNHNLKGHIFYPVVQYPSALCRAQQTDPQVLRNEGQHWIQDMNQIVCYEDKQLQMESFSKWMPLTRVFTDRDEAFTFAHCALYPLVSKAREGSSSYNVRILNNIGEGVAEVDQVFSDKGFPLTTQPKVQKGYWLVQEFIPHDITYRVTIVGTKLHIYQRFCYPDKAVAAPARVMPTQPVDYSDRKMQDLLRWSREVFEDISTKFCAIDVLWDDVRQQWALLETSLAWARGDDPAANSKFYESQWSLNTQWDLLIDEIEAGVFGGPVIERPKPKPFVRHPNNSKLTVVCWLWDNSKDAPEYEKGARDWRALRDRRRGLAPKPPSRAADGDRKYTAEHVNALQRQFAKYLTIEHRFVCITDMPEGLAPEVEHLETPAAARALAKLPSPEGARFPSCYRRLWMWSDEAQVLGDRVLLVDIDTMLRKNINHLVDNDADFIGWEPRMRWGSKHRVMGALYLLRTGAYPQVWADFRGAESIKEAARAGYRGSDQAWIGYKLGDQIPVWPDAAGIYSIRDLEKSNDPPPADACLIQFNGPRNPWNFTGKEIPSWVAGAWREATAPATVTDA